MENRVKIKSKVFPSSIIDDHMIVYDDTEERVTIYGRDSKQLPLIICLPGASDTRLSFRYISSLLSNEGFRVISVDLRGMGFTPSLETTLTINDVTNDVYNIINYFKIPKRRGVIILSHGESCIPAIMNASAYTKGYIKGMILISPIAGKIKYINNNIRGWDYKTWFDYYKSLYGKPFHKLPYEYDKYIDIIKHLMRYNKRLNLCYQYIQSSSDLKSINLKHIHCPVYIALPGMKTSLKDVFDLDYMHHQISNNVPIIETMVYNNSGHYIHVESANELAKNISHWIIRNYSFDDNDNDIINKNNDSSNIKLHNHPINRMEKNKSGSIVVDNVS